MKKIKLYFITDNDMGMCPILEPRIPESAGDFEENKTKRICCSNTITGCISSTDIHFRNFKYGSKEKNHTTTVWLYSAYVPLYKVRQPTNDEVFDEWETGEFWVTRKQKFNLLSKCIIRKHMELPNSVYSRFSFRFIDEEEVIDKKYDLPVYGEYNSFSYIGLDLSRHHEILFKSQYEENNDE